MTTLAARWTGHKAATYISQNLRATERVVPKVTLPYLCAGLSNYSISWGSTP